MNETPDLPANDQAEKVVLGALMVKNVLSDRISWLKPEYFADQIHGLIFSEAMRLIDSGTAATPVTLAPLLTNYSEFHDVGGTGYLLDLCSAAYNLPVFIVDYAKEIVSAHLRRTLIGLGEDVISEGFSVPDPGQIISRTIGKLEDLGKLIGQDGLRSVSDYREDVLALYQGKRKPTFSTGFRPLDPLYRIRGGEMSVVTGEPSSGKSEVVDAIAVNVAMSHGWKFAVCSFENQPDEHIGKLCEKYLAKRFHAGKSERMGEEDLNRAMDWVDEHFKFIRAEKDSPSIEWALGRARSAVDRFGARGLILDPYNRFEHMIPGGMREDQYIAKSLSSVSRFAANNDAHVWFVAHPAKPAQDRRNQVPSLYDIAGGAHWANIADCGISVHRPFLPDGRRSSDVEVHVKKVRFRACGEPGIAKLRYSTDTGRYSDIFGAGSAPTQQNAWQFD